MVRMLTTDPAAGPAYGGHGWSRGQWSPPLFWRFLLGVARLLVPLFCRLRVTGDVPAELRRGPLILACNHIGVFDPLALVAACATRGMAPRIMATGGVFRIPVAGRLLGRCGHIPVLRGTSSVPQALEDALEAIRTGGVVVGYPEGRISLDPGLWPERGKTGLARLAMLTGVPVVPVAQWGAHEMIAWGRPGAMLWTALTAAFRRPTVKVHFGAPVDLTGLSLDDRSHPQRAADRITEATVATLRPLRMDEPGLPRYVDPTRPISTERSYRRPPGER